MIFSKLKSYMSSLSCMSIGNVVVTPPSPVARQSMVRTPSQELEHQNAILDIFAGGAAPRATRVLRSCSSVSMDSDSDNVATRPAPRA